MLGVLQSLKKCQKPVEVGGWVLVSLGKNLGNCTHQRQVAPYIRRGQRLTARSYQDALHYGDHAIADVDVDSLCT